MSDVTLATGPAWVEAWSLDEGQARARDLFAASFGVQPETVQSSPGRVTIIGDHTDYARGLALATTIPQRVFVAVRAREDHAIRMVSAEAATMPGPGSHWEGSLDTLAPGSVDGWPAYAAGVVWALSERGFLATGLDIAITGCVPVTGGLGSSAALTTAVARACDAVWGLALDSEDGSIELAHACWDAERRFVGVPCGTLDAHTILRCRPGKSLLLDFASDRPEACDFALDFAAYGLRLLVIDTQERRADREAAFTARTNEAETIAALLGDVTLRDIAEHGDLEPRLEFLGDATLRGRARHIVTETRRVLQVTAELTGVAPAHERFLDIGAALLGSHHSLRGDYAASTPAVDAAVDAAFASGALGARMVGVGFGGTALALVRATDAQRIAARVEAVLRRSGHPRPQFLLV